MFTIKMQKKNDMMIFCYPAERKIINWWGYIMMLWSHFVRVWYLNASRLKLIYSEKARKFDEIT